MKKLLSFFLPLFLLCSISACSATTSPQQTQEKDLARQVLSEFLIDLQTEKYQEASALYGGTYEIIENMNPEMDPQAHAALWQNACQMNGFQCLQARSIELDQEISPTEFIFQVEFLNADGSLFVQGPCCGATETESPPNSVFSFTVVKNAEESYQVMDLPPYVP